MAAAPFAALPDTAVVAIALRPSCIAFSRVGVRTNQYSRKRRIRSVATITHLRVPGGSSAMGAAIKFAIDLGSMSDDAAAAMRALGRQGLDRAFEAVEDIGFIAHKDGERLVVIISAQ